jgi:hypothetical protein
MIFDDIAGRLFELVHERLKIFGSRELDKLLALPADEVMSVVVFSQRIAVAAIIGMHASSHAQIGEQLQRTVDSHETDFRMLLSSLMDHFGPQPAVTLCEGLDHGKARRGQSESALTQRFKHSLHTWHTILIENIFH